MKCHYFFASRSRSWRWYDMCLQRRLWYNLQWHYLLHMIKHTLNLPILCLRFHSDDRNPLYSSKYTFRTQNVFQPIISPPKLGFKFHFSDIQGIWENKSTHQGYDVKFLISGRKTFYFSQHTSQTQSSVQYGQLFLLEPGLG